MTRYRYDLASKGLVEISADWTDAEKRAPVPTEGVVYSNLRTTDGVDVSSRTKHRDYMKSNGLALVGDYAEAGPKARAAREDRTAQRKDIQQTLGRALYQQKSQRKNR